MWPGACNAKMPTMNYEHLLVSCDGPITTITLNRPEKRNALALNVMLELTQALRTVAQSEALGVILAANGPVFSAGHNFGDMAGATLEQARELFTVCTAMMDAIQLMPQPVIAKVHAGHRRRLPAGATCDPLLPTRPGLPFRAARPVCFATRRWWRSAVL
jgi:1,4-dihydroxy-2-naphthoyl-CoA synthase